MAASGIHAEIKKIVTKVTKELIRKHPMFVNAAQWHKQMQDTCRSQQQQIDLMAQRLRKLEHDNFEFTRQIEALTKGKPHQTTNQKPEPEVPAAPPMSAVQIRRLRNKYQFSQDNFAKLLGVSTGRYNKWEKGKQPVPPDIAKQLDEIRSMKASDLRSRMINSGVFQPNGMSARQQQKEDANKPARIFLQSPLTDADLRQIRFRLKMTQKRMAVLLGIPVATYQTWECNRAHMPDKHTERINEISRMEPENSVRHPGHSTPSPFTSQKLKLIRASLQCSQAKVAERLGVKKATYQSWEQGKSHMPDVHTQAMQVIFDSIPKDASGAPITPSPAEMSKLQSPAGYSPPSPLSSEDLKNIRITTKLSQRLFAKEIGVKTTTYQAWECGRARMPDRYTDTVRKISNGKHKVKKISTPAYSAYSDNDLKKIRAALQFTQRKIASKIGVNVKTYQAWELGRSPMPDSYTKLVRDLELSISAAPRPSTSSTEEKDQNIRAGHIVPSPLSAQDLRTIRASIQLSQKKMAQAVGVPVSTYTTWELARAHMPDKHTSRLRELERGGAIRQKPQGNDGKPRKHSSATVLELTSEIMTEIRHCRELCELQSDEMALLLEIKPNIYSSWESGRTNCIPEKDLERIRHLVKLPNKELRRFIARRVKKAVK